VRTVPGDIPDGVQAVLLPHDWDLGRLLALDLPPRTVVVVDYEWMLDLPMWRDEQGRRFRVTPNQVRADPGDNLTQWHRTLRADLIRPIHVTPREGRSVIIDGIHRLLKAALLGRDSLAARVVSVDDWVSFQDPSSPRATDQAGRIAGRSI
jgi:hypothetical protein